VNEDIVLYGQYTESWGYEAIQRLMSHATPPDALFAANNSIALGVLEGLHTLGLNVPEDVAVVCFDDTTKMGSARFLTTASQPAQEMGQIAARLLLDRFAEPDKAPEDIVLPIVLHVRNSCGCRVSESPDAAEKDKSLYMAC
jgi:LacI family transcriptional regulator, galactose operon repressor